MYHHTGYSAIVSRTVPLFLSVSLADPRSITITAKPAQRITVGQLMTVNPQDPASIIKLLGAGVTAND